MDIPTLKLISAKFKFKYVSEGKIEKLKFKR
jgi:hypothetical protein